MFVEFNDQGSGFGFVGFWVGFGIRGVLDGTFCVWWFMV